MRLKTMGLVMLACLAICHGARADDIINVPAGASIADLDNALQQARDLRAKHGSAQHTPVRIKLAPGEYALDRPWVIKPEDSGTAEAPLIIESAGASQASLVGAKALPRKDIANGVWRYAPEQAITKAQERAPGTFYVGSHRGLLARQPNQGEYYFVRRGGSNQKFVASQADVRALSNLISSDQDRAIVQVMQSWTASEHRIASLDTSTGEIGVSPVSKWAFLEFGRSQRFAVFNIPAAFDAPGEWIAMNGLLQYRPPTADASPDDTKAYWPHLNTLIAVRGDAKSGQLVQHVQINNLRLAYTTEPKPVSGFIDTQAAVKIGASLEVDQAADIKVTGCKIEHTGNYGIWMRQGVQNGVIEHNVLQDLGAGGIRIGMADVASGERPTGHIKVDQNVVSRTGLEYPGAVGIWVGKSSDNIIDANVVAHTTYSAISVGWQWGYDAPTSGNNLITGNVLLDIGQGALSDMAGIYTLGRSPGTKITGNFIRGVADYPAYGAGGWGIYNDEGSSDIEVRDNVVLETRSGGYHLHFGRDNVVQHNLFGLGKLPEISWKNTDKSGAWKLRDNALVNTNRMAMDVRGDRSAMQTDGNVVSNNADGEMKLAVGARAFDVTVKGKAPSIQGWQQTVAQARSLVQSLGAEKIADIDTSSRLLASKKASQISPSSGVSWQFADEVVGSVPNGLRFNKALPKGVLGIADSDSGGTTNGRCLRFTQGLNNGLPRFEPHTYVPLDYDDGETTIHFTVKLEQGGALIHEVRDAMAPYHVGVSLRMSSAGLSANGVKLAPLRLGEWTTIDITIKQPAGKTATWDLRLKDQNGQTHTWANQALKQADMNGVNWVGFFSDTDQVGAACLGQLAVTNKNLPE